MAVRYSRFFRSLNIFADVAILNLVFYVSNAIYYHTFEVRPTQGIISQFLYLNLFWLVSSNVTNLYSVNRVVHVDYMIKTILKTLLLHVVLVSAFVTLFKMTMISITFFLTKYIIFIGMLFLVRAIIFGLLKMARKRGLNYRNVVLVGDGFLIAKLKQFFIRNKELGYRVLNVFNLDAASSSVDTVESIKQFTIQNNIDEIYCCLSNVKNEDVHELISFAEHNLIRVKLLPDFSSFANKQVQISFYGDLPVMTIRREPLEGFYNMFLKRLFDLAFSLMVIILVLSWLYPVIALLIKLSSKGPVLFRQARSGRDNQPFTCFKFRSMQVNDDADALQATKGDARITPIGRFLRRTNIDEMPQFFNVLMGDMSIVGPRPHMLKHTEQYSRLIDRYMVRHYVKPGITGWAQAHGYRGETTNPEMMERRVEHDVWYIENWSPLLDINIVFLTIVNMIKGEDNAV